MEKITFPFNGNFQEFLRECFVLIDKHPSEYSEYFKESTIRNYISSRPDMTPKNPDTLQKVYEAFQVKSLTGKSFRWFFLFGQFRTTDPELNPLLEEQTQRCSEQTPSSLLSQQDMLPLASALTQLTQAIEILTQKLTN